MKAALTSICILAIALTSSSADAQRRNKKAKPACELSYLPFVTGTAWEYQWVAPDGEVRGPQATSPTKFRVEVKAVVGGKKSATITLVETYRKHSIETQIKCGEKGVQVSPHSFFFIGEPGGGLGMTFENIRRDGPDLPAKADYRAGLNWTADFKAKVVRTAAAGSDAKLSGALLEIEREMLLRGSERINTPVGDFRPTRLEITLSAQAAIEPAVDKWVPLPQGAAVLWLQNGVGVVKVLNRFGHGWELTKHELPGAEPKP